MRVCFLLGSGISLPTGLPSVTQITERVLAGDGFFPTSQESWELLPEGQKPSDAQTMQRDEKLPPLLRFLHWLKIQAASRYADWPYRSVNYEDLAYLAGQIGDDVIGNYENPALAPFIGRAYDTWNDFADRQPRVEQIGRLARKADDYIHDVVAALLAKTPGQENHLDLFLDAARDSHLSSLDLFTLNHDTLLESFLTAKGLPPVDGFTPVAEAADGIRRWNPEVFDAVAQERKVRVLKLHGSVDWHRFRSRRCVTRQPDDPWLDEIVGIQMPAQSGGQLCPYEPVGRSLFLTGIFNKFQDYNDQVFLELHHRFHRVLAECEHIIVCGYGFGDKGVNQRVVERMSSPLPSMCRLLVIDPAPTAEIAAKARFAISGKLAAWAKASKPCFLHWQEGLGDANITWERIVTQFIQPRD